MRRNSSGLADSAANHQTDWFVTRWLFLLGGLLCLALATAGALLPVLPCTPFVLLAVYCFARSSKRLHNWLLNSRLFGGIIRDWQQHRAIRRQVRSSSVAIILVVVVLTLSIVQPNWIAAMAIISLVGIGLMVIFRLPVCD